MVTMPTMLVVVWAIVARVMQPRAVGGVVIVGEVCLVCRGR